MTLPPEVLIVGAGPTGLVLACHLRKLGRAVRIIDKKSGPSTTSKAIGLQYRASEMLALLGVVDRFIERGGSPTSVNMLRGRQKLVTLRFTGFAEPGGRDAFTPRPIMLPQSETEQLLIELLRERGTEVEWNTELRHFDQDEHQVRARLHHSGGDREEVVKTPWLVSCEGAHSVVRKLAGLEFHGETRPERFLMADVEVIWDRPHGEHYVWFHPHGSVAALSMPAPRTFRLFVEMAHTEEASAEPTLEAIDAVVRQRLGDVAPKLTNPTWISEFRIHCRMVDRYRAGRVFLAGDAAHIHSPTGGQGIVTGIQDATNLAWKLVRVLDGAPATLLDTYQEERLPKAREVLHESNKMLGLFTASGGMLAWMRDWLVLPLLRQTWVQRMMLVKLAQLHVNYRGCSLSTHDDAHWLGHPRLRAGDRAPDVAFRKATGEIVSLFALLQPMRPVALVGGPEAVRWLALLREKAIDAYPIGPGEPHPDRLTDAHGDFALRYGMTGEFLCLIRPDDHIGLFLRPIREDRLRAGLARYIRPD